MAILFSGASMGMAVLSYYKLAGNASVAKNSRVTWSHFPATWFFETQISRPDHHHGIRTSKMLPILQTSHSGNMATRHRLRKNMGKRISNLEHIHGTLENRPLRVKR